MKRLIFLLFIAMQTACYYDVEEEIYPDTGCDLADITYSGSVEAILRRNCYSCHNAASNFGNVTLEGYTNLKGYVNSGLLLGVIRHEPGYLQMPQNAPQLLECDLQKIEKWVQDGAPNN